MNEVVPLSPLQNNSSLYTFSWGMVAYTLIIILWGAWVRISGSGDGCGDHWPLCHGAAVPLGSPVKTWIEVSHRYSTALFGVLILLQIIWVFRKGPSTSSARRWVVFTLIFTITEALIGRSLVKEGLVTDSESLLRLVVMPLHLLNTSALIFSQVMTAESIQFNSRTPTALHRFGARMAWMLLVIAVILLTTGAIAALGAHLLPAESISIGLQQDFQSHSHLAVKLRLLHPVAGLLIPMIVAGYFFSAGVKSTNQETSKIIRQLSILTLCMMVIGIATLMSLSPVWLKLLHLTVANCLVITLSRFYFFATRLSPQ
jgi:cytochrome c oxidase assembly protein subunit 15